jgi:hypothetical protein
MGKKVIMEKTLTLIFPTQEKCDAFYALGTFLSKTTEKGVGYLIEA